MLFGKTNSSRDFRAKYKLRDGNDGATAIPIKIAIAAHSVTALLNFQETGAP